MDAAHVAGLVSALFGASGTAILYFFSYTDQPVEGSPLGGPQLTAWNERIKIKNKRWKRLQRAGFALLCISFVIQASAAFVT